MFQCSHVRSVSTKGLTFFSEQVMIVRIKIVKGLRRKKIEKSGKTSHICSSLSLKNSDMFSENSIIMLLFTTASFYNIGLYL